MTVDHSYNYSLSKMFTPVLLDAFINSDTKRLRTIASELFSSGVVGSMNVTFKQALDRCYKHLSTNHRTEYIYKNYIINQLLLDNHSLHDVAVIPEFNVGLSKADIAVFNGTSTVYEIKTELDKLERLPSQMLDYAKFFDLVNIVTDQKYLSSISELVPNFVGIYTLDRENKIVLKRRAKSNKKNIQNKWLMASLRQNEFTQIIFDAYGWVPDVPNTSYYRECEKLFIQLPQKHAHAAAVKSLLARKLDDNQIDLIERSPESLKGLLVSKKYSEVQCEKIQAGLRIKLG